MDVPTRLPGPTTAPRDDDRLARVALSLLARPGSRVIAGLVARTGAPAALDHLAEQLSVHGVEAPTLERAEQELSSAARRGVRFVIPGDEEWPDRLEGLDDPSFGAARGTAGSIGLWLTGPLRLHVTSARSAGVVGSRAPTDYGLRMAAEFGHDLAAAGWTTVSGAAYGIDAAVHRGSLAAAGETVAVLAGGVDVRYPAGNTALLERIAHDGLLVSEVPLGMAATRHRFLVRNRLIAAVSAGTVLVEAGLRSGARNTVAHARALTREVLVMPGPVTSAMSVGCHAELRQPGSTLVTTTAEVLESLAPVGQHLPLHLAAPAGVRDAVPPVDQSVLEAVPVRAARSAQAVARTAGLPAVVVAGALTRLESHGFVRRTGDGWLLTERGRAPAAALAG